MVRALVMAGVVKVYRYYVGHNTKKKLECIGITKLRFPRWEKSVSKNDDEWPSPTEEDTYDKEFGEWFESKLFYFLLFFFSQPMFHSLNNSFLACRENMFIRGGKKLLKVLLLFKTRSNAPLSSFLAFGSMNDKFLFHIKLES